SHLLRTLVWGRSPAQRGSGSSRIGGDWLKRRFSHGTCRVSVLLLGTRGGKVLAEVKPIVDAQGNCYGCNHTNEELSPRAFCHNIPPVFLLGKEDAEVAVPLGSRVWDMRERRKAAGCSSIAP